NTGFYYLRARYMNPSIGRFVTMDTWEGNNYDPRSLHKYLYCGNDPINRTDPSGHFFGGVVNVAFNLSISSTIRSQQFKYYNMLLKNLIDAKEISDIMLDTAVRLQDVCLQLVAEGKWYEGITMNAYNTARRQEAKAYKALGLAMSKNGVEFGNSLLNSISGEFKIQVFEDDYKTYTFGLGELNSDLSDPNIEDNTQEYFRELGEFKKTNNLMKEIMNKLFASEYTIARRLQAEAFKKMESLLSQ
ncbi:MAG: RHS repeat-associated core domain-containing protein, partial [Halanaerobacter sp.]